MDISDPLHHVTFWVADLSVEEAKRQVEEAAQLCDPNWEQLYRFPAETAT